jgi:MFS family permease
MGTAPSVVGICWGVLATAQGLIQVLWLLMVDRFLLGVVEAAVIPASLVFLAHWFTSGERGRANTLLIPGNPITLIWMSALSGYLIELTSWPGCSSSRACPRSRGRSRSARS